MNDKSAEYLHWLGGQGQDHLTGMVGWITGITYNLTGCVQIYLDPGALREDGTPTPGLWVDVDRVELAEDKKLRLPGHSWDIRPSNDGACVPPPR